MKNLTKALYKIRLFLVIISTAETSVQHFCALRVFRGLSFEAHVCLRRHLHHFENTISILTVL